MTFEVSDILALIASPEHPPDNWRVIRPFTRLRQIGVDARWAWGDDDQMLPSDPERTILVIPRQTGTDAATIDRWLAERRSKVRAMIYDFDDVLWGPDMVEHLQLADFTQGMTPETLLHEGEMSRYFMSQCDGVTVSSEPLAEAVRQFVDVPVVLVPNAIDTRWFRCQMAARAPWAAEGRVTIGWVGGRRPERDVTPMAIAWGRIAKRYPHVKFVVGSSLIPDVIYREVEDIDQIIRLPWLSWHDYPVAYQVDIGCCAVADTPFSRAKTPIKCWEYSVAGAAVVGTDVLYGDCLVHGGYTAETADDWDHALAFLIERSDVRYIHTMALLSHVEQHHSLDGQIRCWPDAYRAIVESRAGVMA